MSMEWLCSYAIDPAKNRETGSRLVLELLPDLDVPVAVGILEYSNAPPMELFHTGGGRYH
jgi:hypothetical protein